MSSFRRLIFHRATSNKTDWLFLLPSLVLLGLFGLPLLALVLHAMGNDFFTFALSTQALTALRLSLTTSTLSVILAIVLEMPLAYILARWKFRLSPHARWRDSPY